MRGLTDQFNSTLKFPPLGAMRSSDAVEQMANMVDGIKDDVDEMKGDVCDINDNLHEIMDDLDEMKNDMGEIMDDVVEIKCMCSAAQSPPWTEASL